MLTLEVEVAPSGGFSSLDQGNPTARLAVVLGVAASVESNRFFEPNRRDVVARRRLRFLGTDSERRRLVEQRIRGRAEWAMNE